eukprot:scaffold376_cov454-Pavlova_lutheri.AAC.17
MNIIHSFQLGSSLHQRTPNSQGPPQTQILQHCLFILRLNSRSFHFHIARGKMKGKSLSCGLPNSSIERT